MSKKFRQLAAILVWLSTWLWIDAKGSIESLWPSAVALAIVFLLRSVMTGLLAGAASAMSIS